MDIRKELNCVSFQIDFMKLLTLETRKDPRIGPLWIVSCPVKTEAVSYSTTANKLLFLNSMELSLLSKQTLEGEGGVTPRQGSAKIVFY